MTLLCPETDGLQAKHRITYIPEGTTREEQMADIVNYAYEKFLLLLKKEKKYFTQLDARRISLILRVKGFTQEEVFHILRKERYKTE